jgi:hypothetical protein
LCVLVPPGCSRTGLPIDDSSTAIGCTDGTVPLSRAYPTVMFVLDRSRSMSTELESSSRTTTRWQALGSGLKMALPSIDTSVQIGALLFPTGTADGESEQCTVSAKVSLQPALGNVAELTALMADSLPGGATPTATAIDHAAQSLLSTRASNQARALVLATDGSPDCNSDLNANTCRCVSSDNECHSSTRCLDDARTIATISKYKAMGVLTYVIGIQSAGDTEFSDVLDAMADAGGRPQSAAARKYYAARSESQLDAALETIAKQVGNCIYLTESVPDSGGTIQLVLDGVVLAETDWSWQDVSNGELVLSANVCSRVLADEALQLVARITCADR